MIHVFVLPMANFLKCLTDTDEHAPLSGCKMCNDDMFQVLQLYLITLCSKQYQILALLFSKSTSCNLIFLYNYDETTLIFRLFLRHMTYEYCSRLYLDFDVDFEAYLKCMFILNYNTKHVYSKSLNIFEIHTNK